MIKIITFTIILIAYFMFLAHLNVYKNLNETLKLLKKCNLKLIEFEIKKERLK